MEGTEGGGLGWNRDPTWTDDLCVPFSNIDAFPYLTILDRFNFLLIVFLFVFAISLVRYDCLGNVFSSRRFLVSRFVCIRSAYSRLAIFTFKLYTISPFFSDPSSLRARKTLALPPRLASLGDVDTNPLRLDAFPAALRRATSWLCYVCLLGAKVVI